MGGGGWRRSHHRLHGGGAHFRVEACWNRCVGKVGGMGREGRDGTREEGWDERGGMGREGRDGRDGMRGEGWEGWDERGGMGGMG